MNKFISWGELVDLSRTSRTTIWRAVKRGELAAPIRLTPGRSVFLVEDVEKWLNSRPVSFGPRDKSKG